VNDGDSASKEAWSADRPADTARAAAKIMRPIP